jgi:hypothetical protein
MAEYIDREATIEFIRLNYCKDCNSYNGVRCRACSFDDAMLALEDVPSADVVEVVRCKDCKHLIAEKMLCTHIRNRIFNTGFTTFSNHFCSYGEKKECEGK